MEKNMAYYLPVVQQIIYWQRRWARDRGIKPPLLTVEENLFQPLTEASRVELGLGTENKLEKEMRSVASPSALICNVFDHWRNRHLEPLAEALGAPVGIDHFHFEVTYPIYFQVTYPIDLRAPWPHLDIVFGLNEPKPFLIEAKFTETYMNVSSSSASYTFTKSYFPDSGEVWGRYGLTRCEDLARRIHASQEVFDLLDAPELLNHILGLAKKFGKDFTLLYLWYDNPSHMAAIHRAEIETFMLRLKGELDFRAMTYQELFQKIQSNPSVDKAYLAYLAERYFA